MFQKEVQLSYGEGRYKIYISAIITGDGISLTVTGGEKPHVGGMALAVPRTGGWHNKTACDIWITPRYGHRDSEVADMVARMLCLDTGQTVAVVAGIHIDQADSREIGTLIDNSRQATLLLNAKIKEIMEKDYAQES